MVKRNTKSNKSNPNPAKAVKRMTFKERDVQNIERCINRLRKFQTILSYGFSDASFIQANEVYNTVKDRLYPTEREALGEAWRNVYTDSNTLEAVDYIITAIETRLNSPVPPR